MMDRQIPGALTPNPPQTPPPDIATGRSSLLRWTPLYLGLILAALQIALMFLVLPFGWWTDGLIFYPLVHIARFSLHLRLTGLTLTLIVVGIIWARGRTSAPLGTVVIVIVPFLIMLMCGSMWWALLHLFAPDPITHADSIDHNGHTYHLLVETNYDIGYNNDWFYVYRCDRHGLFCRAVNDRDYFPIYYGSQNDGPAVDAIDSGDLYLSEHPNGWLYIHFYDDEYHVPGSGGR